MTLKELSKDTYLMLSKMRESGEVNDEQLAEIFTQLFSKLGKDIPIGVGGPDNFWILQFSNEKG